MRINANLIRIHTNDVVIVTELVTHFQVVILAK